MTTSSATSAPVSSAVLGAGSWGTTFAKVLADAGNPVKLWARRREIADAVNDRGENPAYLPGVALPPGVRATPDAEAALAEARIVALAVPAQHLRDNLRGWAPLLRPDATVVSLMKGVELGTALRMSEVILELTGLERGRVAVVSGPNLAREIAIEQPTATVIACAEQACAEMVQHATTTRYFRPYTNVDVVGCELGGAVKNVIALACGMARGLGFGDNTLGSLITRGLAETARLGERLGANPLTFAGLAGLGDLVATCVSPLSRNRTFGERLGAGESLQQAQEATHGQVVEGVKSCAAVLELAARHDVDMPISRAVDAVCHRGLSPLAAVDMLMGRSPRHE